VSLLTENGGTKDDLRLPTDESLLTQVRLVDTYSAFYVEICTKLSNYGYEELTFDDCIICPYKVRNLA